MERSTRKNFVTKFSLSFLKNHILSVQKVWDSSELSTLTPFFSPRLPRLKSVGSFRLRYIKKLRLAQSPNFKPKRRVNQASKNKSSLSALSKKQKKRIKFKKLKKIIRPGSKIFRRSFRISRNETIFDFFLRSPKKFIIHDGYSWWVKKFQVLSVGLKCGSICFHTRATSHVSVHQKGRSNLEMKQKLTFKLKTVKVKRKK